MRFAFAVLTLLLPSLLFAQPSSDALERAKDHFRRGTQLYDLGDYVQAAGEYQEAFKLSERPGFLFNIAQAYRLAGKAQEAVAAYRGFVRRVPDSPQRQEAERYINELSSQLAEEADRLEKERAANATVVSASPQTRAPERRRTKPWVWALVGVSAVAVVGIGVGLGIGFTRPNDAELPADVPLSGIVF